MNRAVVGAGSNIDSNANVAAAGRLLASEHRLVKESPFVRTAPIGFAGQPEFLNGAFLVDTDLDREGFERYLKEVESRLGRVRGENKFGPRTIDLDLVVWNGSIVDPDYETREFLRESVRAVLPELTAGSYGAEREPSRE